MNESTSELVTLINLILQSYSNYSIVSRATRRRVFNETTDRSMEFTDLGISETVPSDWFGNPAICPEPFFYDIGRELAIAEEKYLVNTITREARAHAIMISQVRLARIREIACQFVEETNAEPVLFIPAELSPPLYVEPNGIEFDDSREFIRIGPAARMDVLLTSKYVALNDLVLIDRTFGTWIYKSGNLETLTVEIRPVGFGNLEINAKTSINYEIERPDAARILRVTT